MDLEALKIDLKGLDEGLNSLSFDLDEEYFEHFGDARIHGGKLHVDIEIVRTSDDIFTLDFHEQGTVVVPCDICLEDMDQPIEARQCIQAKFGEDFSEDDDLVTVAENEGILDVAWYIYEFMVLAIPIKHVHAPGKCNPAMIRVLNEHSAARSGEEGEKTVDPRWEALSKLNITD